MASLIAKTALAAILAVGALTASTAGANAHVRLGITIGEPGYPYLRRAERCASWLALDKARWNGIRRPQITRIGPNRVVVEGPRIYRWGRIVFANVRGCPVISQSRF